MIKYDRDKHVELITVASEALAAPTVLRQAAEMAEKLGLTMSSDYDGLKFFRDKTDEELAKVAEDAAKAEELRAEHAERREQRDREQAAEWGWTYEEYLDRQRAVRGY
jgi:hypothetical protein